jgi:hypothetical protein
MIREPHQIAALFDLDNIWHCSESVYVIRAARRKRDRTFQLTVHEDGWTFVRSNYIEGKGFNVVAMPEPFRLAVLPAVLLGDIPIMGYQAFYRHRLNTDAMP